MRTGVAPIEKMISQPLKLLRKTRYIADIQGEGLKIFGQNRKDFMPSISQDQSQSWEDSASYA